MFSAIFVRRPRLAFVISIVITIAGLVSQQVLPVEQFPHFSEMVAKYYMRPEYSFAEEFDIGLSMVLDGIERLRAEES